MQEEKFCLEWYDKWGIRATLALFAAPPLLYFLENKGIIEVDGVFFGWVYAILFLFTVASITQLYNHYWSEWHRARRLKQEVRELRKRLEEKEDS